MNEPQAGHILSLLHGAYPTHPIDEDVMNVWANTLAHTEHAIAEQAVRKWILTENWFPKPSEINGMITMIRRELSGHQQEPRGPSERIATREEAAAALLRGYRQALGQRGFSAEEIERRVAKKLANATHPKNLPIGATD